MSKANWRTQAYNVVQSLLFNNPNRVIRYFIRDAEGNWRDRAESPAPVRRLYETQADQQRTCLHTIQFVHHMLIPPGGQHVAELHMHPDAEELVVVMRGRGTATVGDQTFVVEAEDVVYIAPGTEHRFANDSHEMLGVLFVNVPTGEGLERMGGGVDGKQ